MSPPPDSWHLNYFNYFTEVEEHFRRARGTGLFLLSPLDWALIESWKGAGVPLEAVLRGIDLAFEKSRARKVRTRQVNSLAYCAQAVMAEAQLMAGTVAATRPAAPPFSEAELADYLRSNAARLVTRPEPGLREIGEELERLVADAPQQYRDLEGLEQHLTVLEEKMAATARAARSSDDLLAARRDLDAQLRPYRGKMSAEQLTMLEKQYLDRRLFEATALPRLSLFYL